MPPSHCQAGVNTASYELGQATALGLLDLGQAEAVFNQDWPWLGCVHAGQAGRAIFLLPFRVRSFCKSSRRVRCLREGGSRVGGSWLLC